MKKLAVSTADVGMASKVIELATRDGYKIRGKIVLTFMRSLTEDLADRACDACERIIASRLRDEVSNGDLPLAEEALVEWLQSQLPERFPRLKVLRVISLHVVGVMGGSGTMTATRPVDTFADVRTSPGHRRDLGVGSRLPAPSAMGKKLLWPRRRSGWSNQLGSLSPTAAADEVLRPIASAVRDGAARLIAATMLAFDHEGFDLYGQLQGRVHRDILATVGREALAFGCAKLSEAMTRSGIPSGRTASVVNIVLFAVDPSRSIATKLPAYLAAADIESEYAQIVSKQLPGQDAAALLAGVHNALMALDQDTKTQAAFLRRWAG